MKDLSKRNVSMQVDLSKARAGDTVKFRCGGMAVIEKCYQRNMHDVLLDFVDCEVSRSYHHNGRYGDAIDLIDITEVIPAPVAFDWSTARWGMAFILNGSRSEDRVVHYVGKMPSYPKRLIFSGGTENTYTTCFPDNLTRAPEHDVEGV